jgi:hypothetical protein
MSAIFAVKFCGQWVQFEPQLKFDAVSRAQATPFISEADAWYAAAKAELPPNHVEVICES